MTEKQAYSYTVLRHIHDVVSGERLNVGVVMHAPAVGFLKVRTRKTVDRLKQALPDLDDAAFTDANVAWRNRYRDERRQRRKDPDGAAECQAGRETS